MSVVDLFVSGLLEAGEGCHGSLGLIVKEGTNNLSTGGNVYLAAKPGVVIAARGGEINKSTDGGITFGADISNNHTSINTIGYGSGVFIAAGSSGELSRSTDSGDTWGALVTNPFGTATDTIHGIAYDDESDVWVAVGADTTLVARSTDSGVTWTQASVLPDNPTLLCDVTYAGSGTFIAVTYDDKSIWRSTDSGDTWSDVYVDSDATQMRWCGYGNRATIASAFNGSGFAIFRSTDKGVTWKKEVDYGSGPDFGNALYAHGMWFAGNNVSLDGGRTWADNINGHTLGLPITGTSIAYDSQKRTLIIGGQNGDTYYSEWLEAGAGIVEQGSNANGEYVVFSNGLQVCWGNGTPSSDGNSGGTYRYRFTLPKTYGTAPPLITGNENQGSSWTRLYDFSWSVDTTQATLYTTVSSLAQNVCYMVIGWA